MLKGEPNSIHILLSDLSEWMESLAVGSVMIVWKGCGGMIKGTIAFI